MMDEVRVRDEHHWKVETEAEAERSKHLDDGEQQREKRGLKQDVYV